MTAVVSNHPHTVRRVVVRAVASVLLLGGAAGGMYEGAQVLVAHFDKPAVEVSYANADYTTSMLHKANHSTATKAGSFLTSAPLPDDVVRGVHTDFGE